MRNDVRISFTNIRYNSIDGARKDGSGDYIPSTSV